MRGSGAEVGVVGLSLIKACSDIITFLLYRIYLNQRVDRYPGWELEIGDRTRLYLYCKQWDFLEPQMSADENRCTQITLIHLGTPAFICGSK
jgi:hypothetical protein